MRGVLSRADRMAARGLAVALGFWLALVPVGLGAAPAAGPAATLLADRIHLGAGSVLIAEGSVEVYFNGSRLSAARIVYDGTTGTLAIEGPLWLSLPDGGGMVLLATSAELSDDLRDGLLQGARMVLADEMQLAANTIRRSEGRYTTLDEVVASSCQICVIDPTPLWEIRARRVVHDAVDRDITYEGAQFRAFGVPLAYIPRLTTPDPSVERRSGLLQPRLRTTSALGTGIKLPYFLALGESRDLTVAPYVSTSRTVTVDIRYREALDFGAIEVRGAVSRDDILPGATRGYLFADAGFSLPAGFALDLDLRAVTDDAYVLDYDITDADRLWSGASVQRVLPDQMIWLRMGRTQSLRDDESNTTQPMLAGTFSWTEVLHPALIGGEVVFEAGLSGYQRSSTSAFDGIDDSDLVADGRDALRASVSAEWRRGWLLPGGVEASALLGYSADFQAVAQDAAFAPRVFAHAPRAALELRWPWLRSTGSATDVIEPVAQLVWTGTTIAAAPNEDSVLVEFDEGNLFTLSRFPGRDAREAGLRANLGFGWTRHDAAGWSASVLAGRVLRWADLGQFDATSALGGARSDWLLATKVQTAGGLEIANRALFDDDLRFSRDELMLALHRPQLSLEAGYLWMQAAPAEGRPDPTKELVLETSYSWESGWAASLGTRYDFFADRAATAEVGLRYANECVVVDLSLSRRFTSSTSVTPQTDFGMTVELVGFGGSSGGRRRTCMR